MHFIFDKDYCKNCEIRKSGDKPPDNTGANCPAGRKNNPLSLGATINVLKNHGQVCSFNPVRKHFGLHEAIAMSR